MPRIAPETVWNASDLDRFYVENVQGGQPFATEMRDIMLRLIGANEPAKGDAISFLDLGCGGGVLSRAILDRYPDASGVLIDFSETMLDLAKGTLKTKSRNLEFVRADLSRNDWTEKMKRGSFDVAVAGFAIHNFRTSDASKRQFYAQVFDLLRPGGLFVNLELVGIASEWGLSISRQLAVDSLTAYHNGKGSRLTGKEVMEEYTRLHHPKDSSKSGRSPLSATVNGQCEWLRSAGFADVDCYFRIFTRAIIAGRRPR